MKQLILIFFCTGALSLFTTQLYAQQDKIAEENASQQKATSNDIAEADLLILANVSAKELKFEIVPNTQVNFPGTHDRKSFWEAERENLPRPAQPGVTYRNIGIQLRIVSRFADIDRIVSEALGEIPLSEPQSISVSNQDSGRNIQNQNGLIRISEKP